MKIFLKKQREILAVALFLVVVFAMIYYLIYPLFNKIKNLKDDIQQSVFSQNLKQQNLSKLPKMQEQYEKIEAQENKFSSSLLRKEDAVFLIEKLEELAKRTYVSIEISIVENKQTNQTNKKGEEKTNLVNNLPSGEYLEMKLNLSGKYADIIQFEKYLEDFVYNNDIVSLEIKGIRKENQEIRRSDNQLPFIMGNLDAAQKKAVVKEGVEGVFDVVFYLNNTN